MFSLVRVVRLAVSRNSILKVGKPLVYNKNFEETCRNVLGGAISVRLQHAKTSSEEEFHSIIKDTEKPVGESTKHEFQAETRMLLDIVAQSLYSEKEVFIRELISNASDALEKFRYLALSQGSNENIKDKDRPLEIHISTDKNNRTMTMQDTGIGMTKDELNSNLGVIARSGSKAFLEELKAKQTSGENIIGQFGVGFYSSFMVADKVEVFTRAANEENGWKWLSDGTGNYEIQQAEGVQPGTKIVLHLKAECREFADEDTVKSIVTKYSNFVGSPIYLNGKKINVIQPLWLSDPKSVTAQDHIGFYKFISGNYDVPRYTLHYKTDVPMSISALLYFPEGKPGLFNISQQHESGVALYTRRVLIKNRTDNIVPKWLRFLVGVVDSEDIPLNLSRELLQESSLIRKLRSVLSSKVIKFLQEQLKKDQAGYEKFYEDYGGFLKEGIMTDEIEKENIAKLLLFESSHLPPGKKITLTDYVSRATNSRDIFYLAAPSRQLAETSPYYESLKKREQEVLFCYEPPDELILMRLDRFQGCRLIAVEKDMRDDKEATDLSNLGEDSLRRSEIDELSEWFKSQLGGKVFGVKATSKLESHPCVVTVEDMASARYFIKLQSHGLSEDGQYGILRPQLEFNPRHPIIKKLFKLKASDRELAELLTKQLFANSMVTAGLVQDPRVILTTMNELLAKALDKH